MTPLHPRGMPTIEDHPILIDALIALAGFAAGFMNVLAGGGSFLTLPVLIAAGLSALGANASSTVALFPAQAATAAMARRTMAMPTPDDGISLGVLSLISLVGGFFGALLLLLTPPGLFIEIVPWLILFATGVFAGGNRIAERAKRFGLGRGGVYAVQTLVSIYGGYFGGGIGIMMLAALTVFGFTDIRKMTGIKIILAMLMNVAAVVTFIVAGLVQWHQTVVLAVAALAGGLVGMATAKSVPAPWVRAFVIATGFALTLAFFLRLGKA
jgi:uncharacterized membrane protein YfcA